MVAVLFVALVATAGQTEFRAWAERLGTIIPLARDSQAKQSLPNIISSSTSPPPGSQFKPQSQTVTEPAPEPPKIISSASLIKPEAGVPHVLANPQDSFWHQGKEYFFVPGRSWPEAKTNAEGMGGSLVKIDSRDLNQRLFRAFGDALWIGLKDGAKDGQWAWLDGQPPVFTNWAPGQPDGIQPGSHAGQIYGQFWKGAMGAWDNHWSDGDDSMRGGIAERRSSKTAKDQAYPLSIEMVPGDWGGSDLENIRQVALSAASQIWKNIRGHKLAKIKIQRGYGAPQLIFARGPQGENFVELNSGSNLWAQIAYQFAHEFYHILAASPCTGIHWFGEVLGETASMFCLRGMAKEWSTQPPYPNWKDYGRSLDDYANALLEEARATRGGSRLPDFIATNYKALESCEREKLKVLAAAMLPIFESNPSAWETVLYGDWGGRPNEPLESFLGRWQEACPPRLQPFVGQISSVLR